jgi:hypothetical protein
MYMFIFGWSGWPVIGAGDLFGLSVRIGGYVGE